MRNKARVAGIFVLVFGAIVTALVFSSRPSYVDVVGHVYESYSAERPVAGAVVSNDWDSTTAKTNDQGEFRLRVRQVAVDEHIKFTARSGERTNAAAAASLRSLGKSSKPLPWWAANFRRTHAMASAWSRTPLVQYSACQYRCRSIQTRARTA